MPAQRRQHNIDSVEKLRLVQIFPLGQTQAAAARVHFFTQAIEALFQQQRKLTARWASPEVILPSALMMPVASSAFCSSVNMP